MFRQFWRVPPYIPQRPCADVSDPEFQKVAAAFGPVYDVERYGVRLVPSPRHADVLLIVGSVTRNMAQPLLRTIEATPTPRFVIAVGDCVVHRNICTSLSSPCPAKSASADRVDPHNSRENLQCRFGTTMA